MPNKYRHIGICLSDGFVFLIVIIGPVVGRYAIDTDGGWRYIYYGGFIAQFISLVLLAWLYHPPKHPRGVAWKEALPGLDYVGTALVVPGVCLVIVGIINTTYMATTSTMVLAPMCTGFGLLVAFGFWETLSKTKSVSAIYVPRECLLTMVDILYALLASFAHIMEESSRCPSLSHSLSPCSVSRSIPDVPPDC